MSLLGIGAVTQGLGALGQGIGSIFQTKEKYKGEANLIKEQKARELALLEKQKELIREQRKNLLLASRLGVTQAKGKKKTIPTYIYVASGLGLLLTITSFYFIIKK